jgi:hypothetical protein
LLGFQAAQYNNNLKKEAFEEAKAYAPSNEKLVLFHPVLIFEGHPLARQTTRVSTSNSITNLK